MGESDTTEKDFKEHRKECTIPQSLLNTLADINVYEINSHIHTNENLHSWLCSWHEKIKQELYVFANQTRGCIYYVDNQCECMSREDEFNDEIKKLKEELRNAQSEVDSLKNTIVKMCYEKFGRN